MLAARGIKCAIANRAVIKRNHVAMTPGRLNGQRRSMTVQAVSGKEAVSTDKAPAALGPYSQAIKANNTLYLSGQLGIFPGTKDFASDTDAAAQADQALKNLGAVLEAGGSSFANVVKTTVLLSDMDNFAAVNAVYEKYFPSPPPARAAYAVKTLPLNALVEIEAVALVD